MSTHLRPILFNFQQIRERAQFSYEVLKLETDAASNMLYINGRLIHRTREEINENSMSVSTFHFHPALRL